MELLNHASVLSYHRTGSSYTCDPPVLNTDEDWVVLYKEECYNDLREHLIHNDYHRTARKYFDGHGTYFNTWRSYNNNLNLICTSDEGWYTTFVEATEIAKEENLLTKEERIACFEMIMRKYRKEEPSRFNLKNIQTSQDLLNKMAQSMNHNQAIANQLYTAATTIQPMFTLSDSYTTSRNF